MAAPLDALFVDAEFKHDPNTSSSPTLMEEERSPSLELRQSEKKALLELRTRLEEAILGNQLLKPHPCDDKSTITNTEKSIHRKRMNSRAHAAAPATSCPLDLRGEPLREISIWGVPLLPSKNHEGTDVVLLKFLRAREFRVPEALDMLRRTLRWRREFGVGGILEEDLGLPEFRSAAYMDGVDRDGHPLCYNVYGVFKDKDLYDKAFGDEESCERFLRWRVQLMEKGIERLSLRPGGIGSIVHITDLKNAPGTAMKELQAATTKTLSVLQDNYPELVVRNIFINVSFRYYAHHALFSRFLTQRTKSKFIFARPSKVAEILLKFVAPEKLPVQYGGLKREDDNEFSDENGGVSEISIRPGGTDAIEIPVDEPCVTLLWDITVVGWEVSYKEEFIPEDEGSYKVLIQNERRIEEGVRNSFYISEPGKVVLTIENKSFKRKKALYRTKFKPTVPMYSIMK